MAPELDPRGKISHLDELEMLVKRGYPDLVESNDATISKLLAKITEERQRLLDSLIPSHVYINMRTAFAPIAFTVPSLQAEIPQSPAAETDPEGMTISLRNNGRYMLGSHGYNGLEPKSWDEIPEIERVQVFGEEISASELLLRRQELLDMFFERMFRGKEQAEAFAASNEAQGLNAGTYLYRAITRNDWANLQRQGTLCYSHLDPSANFENERLFQAEGSQVRHYVEKTGEGYTGIIIRWPIEHPLLYRITGGGAFRVVPFFSHFLPTTIDISSDKGATFKPL